MCQFTSLHTEHFDFTSGVTKNLQESRVKKIHYGFKRKQLSFWEKFRLNNSLKRKVQHYKRYRKQILYQFSCHRSLWHIIHTVDEPEA